MRLKIEKCQAMDRNYLKAFILRSLDKDKSKLLVYKTGTMQNITLTRPYNMNTNFQQLSENDVFMVLEKVKQWFSLEFKDFNKKGLNIRLIDSYCDSDSYLSEKYKASDFHLLCGLKGNELTLYRNSHLNKHEILCKLERIFIHEMAHIKWSKLSITKKMQYYLAYRRDGGFSPSLHTKGNINEDIAARTEEFIRFREEYKGIKQMEHRFRFIEKWFSDENGV